MERYGQLRVSGAHQGSTTTTDADSVLERARSEYQTWRDDVELRAVIGDADYREGLLARKSAVIGAERAFAEALRESEAYQLAIDEAIWSTLALQERRELLRAGIDAVVLRRASSTATPLADRVEIIWAGELEHDDTRAGIAAAVRRTPRGSGVLTGQDAS